MKSYLAIFIVVVICIACNEPPAGYFPPLCEKDAKLCPSNKDVHFENPSYILTVKDIAPLEVSKPNNPSIAADKNGGFYVAFRTDHYALDSSVFQSHTGVVRLDSNLNVVPKSLTMLLGSKSRQDARLLTHNDGVYVVYNDLPPFETFRTLFLASLSFENGKPEFTRDAPLQAKTFRTEKNWVPFIYTDASLQEHLMLSYSANPHKVLKVFDSHAPMLSPFSSCKKQLPWKWGGVRGGTPAKLIGDEYVSFFHSFFFDRVYNARWYVFGAYTFDAKPPFCMKRISAEPLYFKEMYSAVNIQSPLIPGRVVFPAGLETGVYQGKESLIVTYGDSDAASKILVLDREKFLETLVAIN